MPLIYTYINFYLIPLKDDLFVSNNNNIGVFYNLYSLFSHFIQQKKQLKIYGERGKKDVSNALRKYPVE